MLFDFMKYEFTGTGFKLKFSWVNTILTVLFCSCYVTILLHEIFFWVIPECLDLIEIPFRFAAIISAAIVILDQIEESLENRRIERVKKKINKICTGALGMRRYSESGSYTGGKTTILTDWAIQKERENSERPDKETDSGKNQNQA